MIRWSDPLILLRVFLTIIWSITAIYAGWVAFRLPKANVWKGLARYTSLASVLGVISYILGVLNGSGIIQPPLTLRGFLGVAALLAFTPACLVLWLYIAKRLSLGIQKIETEKEAIRIQLMTDQQTTMDEQNVVMGEQRVVMAEQREDKKDEL